MIEEQVRADFDRARHKAFLRGLLALVTQRPNDPLPYHEVRKRVAPEGESYRGVQAVPLDKIVGSTDRFRDFDRAFLPRRRHTAGRWQNVDRAYYEDVTLPPIQLYKVGDVYFVKDGNHRVSVAREKGQDFIDAEVVEQRIPVPLFASMSPEELLLQLEYAEFLRRTNLDRLRPDHDIRPTALGRYDEIYVHILGHRQALAARLGRPVSTEEAVVDWYDHVYSPIVRLIREREVLERFPGRSEADLYLWIMARRDELARRYGREVPLEEAVVAYAEDVAPWRKLIGPLRVGLRRLATPLGRLLRTDRPATGRLDRAGTPHADGRRHQGPTSEERGA